MFKGQSVKRCGMQRGRAMPKSDAHPLVLAVLQAVHRATAVRRAPFYVGVMDLDLGPDPQRNGAAIQLAALRG